MGPTDRIRSALHVAVHYGGFDGAHHKAWVIDQMVRALTAGQYEDTIKAAKAGKDGPETYEWDEGTPP